jgi:hypothetical protein
MRRGRREGVEGWKEVDGRAGGEERKEEKEGKNVEEEWKWKGSEGGEGRGEEESDRTSHTLPYIISQGVLISSYQPYVKSLHIKSHHTTLTGWHSSACVSPCPTGGLEWLLGYDWERDRGREGSKGREIERE